MACLSEYVDTSPDGGSDPILFIHGNPSSSYSWHKVIPKLSNLGRCIAPSLIGFGESGKPGNIPYSFFNQATYLEKFIESLGIQEKITLVIQD